MSRFVACSYLITDCGRLTNQIVEISGSTVVGFRPLEGEPAMTEWLGGTIEINDGKAYHQPPGKKSRNLLTEHN